MCTGQKTLNTTGKIISVDVSYSINREMRCGMFVVVSTLPRGHFACQGDSGAAVVDMENGVVRIFFLKPISLSGLVESDQTSHHAMIHESNS